MSAQLQELENQELSTYVNASICYGIVKTGVPQETGVPAVEVKDIVDGKINVDTVKKTTPEIDSEYTRSRLKTGDIVIAIRGTIGRVAIVPESLNGGNITRDVARIRVDDPDKRDYIYYYLTSKVAENHLRDNNIGQAVKGINIKDLKKLPVHIPAKIEEIKKLNKIFKTSNSQIETLKSLISEKEAQKKALMQKLLTGKVRFTSFNDQWRKVKLSEISRIKKGTQLNKLDLTDDGQYPAINGGINPSGYTDSYNTNENTITISEGGNSCGFVNYITTKFWSGGHCYTIQELKENSYFIYQYLKNIERQIMKLRVGSGLPNIQKGDIENLKVLLPSTGEQEKIVEVLYLASKEIELLYKQLSKEEEEKKGLMQKLFTGEVRGEI